MIRIGMGCDVHRLVEGRRLVLGGVTIPFEKGLEGHSDADVLAHAVTDALLGAAALGDIGQHFPDTDPAYKDTDSIVLLRKAWEKIRNVGYMLGNLDANVIAERPKLAPYIAAIRQRLAETLEVEANVVSVKAKTNERVGPEGRGEAIRAEAVVLLQRRG